jgi:hypothetical protein
MGTDWLRRYGESLLYIDLKILTMAFAYDEGSFIKE